MTTLEMKAQEFLAQKRLAVAGVSGKTSGHPTANLIYHRLKNTGHEVFAVNPHLQTFEGDRCYADVKTIPGGVDGVVIVTKPETSAQIAHDCADAGVPRVWMHQSLASGSSVSPEGVEYCRARGVQVIAGGCPMMFGDGVDFGHRCLRWMLKIKGLPLEPGAPS